MQRSHGTQLHKGRRQNGELGEHWRKGGGSGFFLETQWLLSSRISGRLAHCALGNPDSLLNAATLSSLPIMSPFFFLFLFLFFPSEAANWLHISTQTSPPPTPLPVCIVSPDSSKASRSLGEKTQAKASWCQRLWCHADISLRSAEGRRW